MHARRRACRRPAPTPPVDGAAPPLSVTEIETWLRDPYAIYAKHVLKLRPLDALDEADRAAGARHRLAQGAGIVRRATIPAACRTMRWQQLIAIADQVFAEAGNPQGGAGAVAAALLKARRSWFVGIRARARARHRAHRIWKSAAAESRSSGGTFTLTGVADRIDILKDGGAAILDYKTGTPPSNKQVEELLVAAIAAGRRDPGAGRLCGIGARNAEELIYLQPVRRTTGGESAQHRRRQGAGGGSHGATDARASPGSTSATRPIARACGPSRADIAGDYDHLARVREWSPSGWSEEP